MLKEFEDLAQLIFLCNKAIIVLYQNGEIQYLHLPAQKRQIKYMQ